MIQQLRDRLADQVARYGQRHLERTRQTLDGELRQLKPHCQTPEHAALLFFTWQTSEWFSLRAERRHLWLLGLLQGALCLNLALKGWVWALVFGIVFASTLYVNIDLYRRRKLLFEKTRRLWATSVQDWL